MTVLTDSGTVLKKYLNILSGSVGISPVYDAMRALGARLRGQKFTPEHSDLTTPQWKNKD